MPGSGAAVNFNTRPRTPEAQARAFRGLTISDSANESEGRCAGGMFSTDLTTCRSTLFTWIIYLIVGAASV